MHFRKEGVISTIRLRQETEREVKDAFLDVEDCVRRYMCNPIAGTTETITLIGYQIQISRFATQDSTTIYVWYRNKKVFIYYYEKPLKDDDFVTVRIFKPGRWLQYIKLECN